MRDPHSLAAHSPSLFNATPDAELEHRLNLYQVFLKLYDQHRNLLNEILSLENDGNNFPFSAALQYVQGMVQGQDVYLVTNLLEGGTQILRQPQGIWTIGRGRGVGISVQEQRLSRCHAAIQYTAGQGFYLIDLNSTNGSFVNGEPIRHRYLLKDGDRVRLGSLAFTFFACPNTCSLVLKEEPAEVLAQLNAAPLLPPLEVQEDLNQAPEAELSVRPRAATKPTETEETVLFLQATSVNTADTSSSAQINDTQKADILDRFFNKP